MCRLDLVEDLDRSVDIHSFSHPRCSVRKTLHFRASISQESAKWKKLYLYRLNDRAKLGCSMNTNNLITFSPNLEWRCYPDVCIGKAFDRTLSENAVILHVSLHEILSMHTILRDEPDH